MLADQKTKQRRERTDGAEATQQKQFGFAAMRLQTPRRVAALQMCATGELQELALSDMVPEDAVQAERCSAPETKTTRMEAAKCVALRKVPAEAEMY